jgi:AbrB family looped-hinge helix DNA binding protein
MRRRRSMMVSLNDSSIVIDSVRPPMTQVKLSSKYQIVIPEDVREQLGLIPGQVFEVLALDGRVVVAVPVRPLSESFGMFPGLDTSDPRDHEDRL